MSEPKQEEKPAPPYQHLTIPCGHPFTRPGEKCQHCGLLLDAPMYSSMEEFNKVNR